MKADIVRIIIVYYGQRDKKIKLESYRNKGFNVSNNSASFGNLEYIFINELDLENKLKGHIVDDVIGYESLESNTRLKSFMGGLINENL